LNESTTRDWSRLVLHRQEGVNLDSSSLPEQSLGDAEAPVHLELVDAGSTPPLGPKSTLISFLSGMLDP
jgi:hypothetical protein